MKRKMMDNTQPNKTIPLAVYINDMKTFKKSVIRIKYEDSSEFYILFLVRFAPNKFLKCWTTFITKIHMIIAVFPLNQKESEIFMIFQ